MDALVSRPIAFNRESVEYLQFDKISIKTCTKH